MVEDRHPVAERLGLLHGVRGEHHGATGVVERAQEVPQVAPCLWVEGPGGLVEEHHLGAVHECAGDRQALRLPAREPLGAGACLVGEPDPLQPVVGDRRPTPYRAAKVRICSRALSRSKKADAWSCTPIRGNRRSLRGQGRSPSRRISPESGLRRPSIISRMVVLPAPFGPRIPKNSPSATLEAHPVDRSQVPVGQPEVGDLDSSHVATLAGATGSLAQASRSKGKAPASPAPRIVGVPGLLWVLLGGALVNLLSKALHRRGPTGPRPAAPAPRAGPPTSWPGRDSPPRRSPAGLRRPG